MATLGEIWDSLRFGAAATPLTLKIGPDRVLPAAVSPPALIRPGADYFQLVVNQLFLAAGRKWSVSIAPMVVAISQFNYDGASSTVPFVIGPGGLKALGLKDPRGMVYSNTKVAGLHPYTGGTVSLSIALCQVPVDNVADRFLSVVETTARALDFSSALASYVKIAGAVTAGLTALAGLDGTKPLLGWRQEFDSVGPTPLAPGYFAIIGDPAPAAEQLWVKDANLYVGSAPGALTPYRDSDFVLFSVATAPGGIREDLDQLPFQALWRQVKQDAVVPGDKVLESLNANLTALNRAILASPDLTDSQKDQAIDVYWSRINATRAKNKGKVLLSDDGRLPPDPFDALRARSLENPIV